MSSKYFCHLLLETPNYNLDEAWTDKKTRSVNYDSPVCKRKWTKITSQDSLWSDDILKKFSSVDIKPYAMRLFKWEINRLFPWHTDYGSSDSAYCVTNWVVQGGGLIDHNDHIELHDHPEGLPFKMKVSSAEDLVLSSTSGHKALIDVLIPHRVNTMGCQTPRITMSVVWKTLNDSELQYRDLRDRFDQINLIDR